MGFIANYDDNGVPLEVRNNFYFGTKAVTTATIRVILMTDTNATLKIFIKALAGNTGVIYVGDVTVAAANGYPLAANEEVILNINHAKKNIYIDASVNGQGVKYIAEY